MDVTRRQIYVSDDGRVTCNEPNCKCEDGTIDVEGRRMTVDDFVVALEEHWHRYTSD